MTYHAARLVLAVQEGRLLLFEDTISVLHSIVFAVSILSSTTQELEVEKNIKLLVLCTSIPTSKTKGYSNNLRPIKINIRIISLNSLDFSTKVCL